MWASASASHTQILGKWVSFTVLQVGYRYTCSLAAYVRNDREVVGLTCSIQHMPRQHVVVQLSCTSNFDEQIRTRVTIEKREQLAIVPHARCCTEPAGSMCRPGKELIRVVTHSREKKQEGEDG